MCSKLVIFNFLLASVKVQCHWVECPLVDILDFADSNQRAEMDEKGWMDLLSILFSMKSNDLKRALLKTGEGIKGFNLESVLNFDQ